MADFTHEVMGRVYREELRKIDRSNNREHLALLKKARRLLIREPRALDTASRRWLDRVFAHNPRLGFVHEMKLNLQEIWERSTTTQDALLRALEDWCRRAEASGIQSLREFARRLSSYRLAPLTT